MEPLRIGVVALQAEGSSDQEISSSIAARVDDAGAEVITCDPGTDGSRMLDCLRRMTAQQVDGWVLLSRIDVSEAVCAERAVDTVDPTGAATTAPDGPGQDGDPDPDAGAAVSPLPPLIVIGTGTGCETAVAGPDETEVGRSLGLALGERAEKDPGCADSVLVVLTDAAAPWSPARSTGIEEGFAARCPEAEPVRVTAVDQEQAFTAMTSALTNQPPEARVLIAAADDTLALGALAAIPEARTDQVVLASVGADRRARCTMRTDDRWIGDAALWPDRYGEVVVPALLDAVAGTEIPPSLLVPSQFLDASVLDVFYPRTECPGP